MAIFRNIGGKSKNQNLKVQESNVPLCGDILVFKLKIKDEHQDRAVNQPRNENLKALCSSNFNSLRIKST